jgi:predicted RNA-binding protein with TRAM domain
MNVVGDSDKSISVGFIASALPGVPTQPQKVEASDEPSITIEWQAPDTDGGSAIQKYSIYVDGVLRGQTPGTQFEYTETDSLVTGSLHRFKVSAVNAIGEGTQSDEQEIIAAKVPGQPLAPTKKSAAATWIEIQFVAPLNGGSAIRGYRIYKDGVQVDDISTTSLMITSNI